MKGDRTLAIEDYTKTIEIDPTRAHTHTNRGTAYMKIGKHENAVEDFSTSIQLNPYDFIACCNRGIAWLHLQEWEKAIVDLRTARNMGVNITIWFRDIFESVANFEKTTGIQLPADIAALLTPP